MRTCAIVGVVVGMAGCSETVDISRGGLGGAIACVTDPATGTETWCPDDMQCDAGLCVKVDESARCSAAVPDGWCPERTACANGMCVAVEGLPCGTDADCAAGMMCQNGVCVAADSNGGDDPPCTPDAETMCQSAPAIVPGNHGGGNTPCGAAADCTAGMTCQDGVCVATDGGH
jgi:hypothetical protein